MRNGDIVVFALCAFFGKVISKSRIPVADVFGCVIKGIAQISGAPFLHVWGDFLGGEYANERFTWVGDYAYEGTMRKIHSKILELGGDSTWIHLPEIGIRGNSHAMMNEDNSDEIADLILDWLDRHFQK